MCICAHMYIHRLPITVAICPIEALYIAVCYVCCNSPNQPIAYMCSMIIRVYMRMCACFNVAPLLSLNDFVLSSANFCQFVVFLGEGGGGWCWWMVVLGPVKETW